MKNDLSFEAEPFEAYAQTAYEEPHDSFNLTHEWDEFAEGLSEPEGEEEFRVNSLPPNVQGAFKMGPMAWPLAVRRAIDAGMVSLSDLTDMVFFMHHPERIYGGKGAALKPGEPQFEKLRKEWLAWRTLIEPMLKYPPKAQPVLPPKLPGEALKYGVSGGVIGSGYLVNRSGLYHTGIDVSPSTKKGGGAEDPRRGLLVYLTLKSSIDIEVLNRVKVAKYNKGSTKIGLGIAGQGAARLQDARVVKTFTETKPDNGYGSGVGLACRYAYTRLAGSSASFTLYIEYWHLITRDTLPFPGQGGKIPFDTWVAAGKGGRMGFGPEMRVDNVLSAGQLTGGSPLLVGYLGATRWPHVHIHVNYEHMNYKDRPAPEGYIFYPRIDPTVVIV
jgi:hypothetical protein